MARRADDPALDVPTVTFGFAAWARHQRHRRANASKTMGGKIGQKMDKADSEAVGLIHFLPHFLDDVFVRRDCPGGTADLIDDSGPQPGPWFFGFRNNIRAVTGWQDMGPCLLL